MLFAWPLLHLRPNLRDVIALILGVAGVALLLGANGFAFDASKLIGVVLSLSCAMLFALGNVLNRTPLPMPPLVVVAWQVGLGCAAEARFIGEHDPQASSAPSGGPPSFSHSIRKAEAALRSWMFSISPAPAVLANRARSLSE